MTDNTRKVIEKNDGVIEKVIEKAALLNEKLTERDKGQV